ncbi:S9 family peptidase [Spongiivirga citrea]|uniref:Prolyl oligopeptidase family serine peptidase n=1 Tax=Spongiivirga citrea TaxID=1481457 RepID=A0A6M0CQB1_9FLAO|nr:S9 family peptidase [Spongiivirga citrea]NER18214.1 prolyl oligopeptidase family serine peptidase [Spongiivirga citrea]
MQLRVWGVLILSFFVSLTVAQNKQLTLEEIWGGEFRTERMQSLHSMNNGKEYTVLNFDKVTGVSAVDKYDYKTQQKVATLISSNAINEISTFTDYKFSADETKLILATEVEQVYRRSRLGMYFVHDITSGTTKLIFDQKIQEPTFSPDGKKVGFVFENNLYFKNLENDEITQITTDGKKNAIINGVTDWVYEEEFAFVRAFDWNKKGDKIAFIRFDESTVPEFSMDVYGQALYPDQQVFKYPKAGEKNADVSLHIFDVNTSSLKTVDLSSYSDFYIARIKFTKDTNVLSAQLLNRHQNKLDLLFIDANSVASKVVLSETDKAYVDVTDNLTFLPNNSFIWTSEKDGFNHIYHYDKTGKLLKQVTKGDWEVTRYYGFNKRNGRIYYQSTETGSSNRGVYTIGINGKGKKALAANLGQNSASFSTSFDYFINTFSNVNTPPSYTLHESKNGKVVKEIVGNKELKQKVADYNLPSKEFFTLTTEKGHALNAWMIKPKDFNQNKEYPLFMFQYSGPGSQQVSNRWNSSNDYWYYMLAQQGYIVACVDGRGTGFKGAEFKKVTYKELGKYEVEDQIDAAIELGKRPYIDAERIGIWGWSYGGFMSSNAILKGNDVFKMAIAVAPVTSWRFYDTIYTERYMQTPQENPGGYDENSPINHVEKLKGDYLLIHGTGDDNVHVQNTMRMVEALVQANKQFDWALYPDKNHGIYGGATRLQLYTKMTNFIKRTLPVEKESTLEKIKG